MTRAWELGRASFDWADFARENRQREAIASEGVAACRLACRATPDWRPPIIISG